MSQDKHSIDTLERRDASTDKRVILAVVGKHGGVHYWHEPSVLLVRSKDKFGGVEFHYRNRPSWAGDNTDGNENCWLLNAKCWHDGSSLMAAEDFTPFWESCHRLGNMEPFWRRLEKTYRIKFEENPNG